MTDRAAWVEHIRELLPEHVLGTLAPEQAAAVEQALARDAGLRAEADALRDAFAALALALPPLRPGAGARERLLRAAAEEQATPLVGLAGRVAALFHVTVEQAQQVLRRVRDPAAWTPGPGQGIELIHVEGGPAGAEASLVRVQPGVRFPSHHHLGPERGLILQGACLDSDGTLYQAGDDVKHPAGTSHDFLAMPGEACLLAVVAFGVRPDGPP